MGVGIFGDQLVELGPDAAHSAAEEAIALLELQVEPEEFEVDETSEETPEAPELPVNTTVFDPAAEQGLADAEEAARLEDEAREAAEAEVVSETTTETVATPDETPKTAHQLVEEIEAAETVEEVDALADGVEFKTVIAAAEKRKEELSA